MDLYTDVERSIQQALSQAALTVSGVKIAIFNNLVSKAEYPNQHGAISIMRISDVFAPQNSGGTKAKIKTPVRVDGSAISAISDIDHYVVQDWPDPFDLMYQLVVSAETVKSKVTIGQVTVSGLQIVRACDELIRNVLRPRMPLYLWDSAANAGAGGWTTNYTNYVYAGYINRDNVAEEMYNRVTNIRFETFSYQSSTSNQQAIVNITKSESVVTNGLTS